MSTIQHIRFKEINDVDDNDISNETLNKKAKNEINQLSGFTFDMLTDKRVLHNRLLIGLQNPLKFYNVVVLIGAGMKENTGQSNKLNVGLR